MSRNREWVLYNVLMAFTLYWISNLILWYPWSISATLGITLMLTVSPLVWIVGIVNCLRKNDGMSIWKLASINAIVFLVVSAVVDFIFFGLIRGAIKELYEPTTFYGYMFLITLPFIVAFVGKKKIARMKIELIKKDFVRVGIIGVCCMLAIIAIIAFDLNIT